MGSKLELKEEGVYVFSGGFWVTDPLAAVTLFVHIAMLLVIQTANIVTKSNIFKLLGILFCLNLSISLCGFV